MAGGEHGRGEAQAQLVKQAERAAARVSGTSEPRTPQGTMLIALVYAGATVVLWGYVYLIMLSHGGALDGH